MKNVIESLKQEGYTEDFSLRDDCLYCSANEIRLTTDQFVVDKEIHIPAQNATGKPQKVTAFTAETLNLKGYFIHE